MQQTEDRTLDYARKFLELFKDRPDQVEYVLRHFNGDVYRKKHKGVKISLRSLNPKAQAGKTGKDGDAKKS